MFFLTNWFTIHSSWDFFRNGNSSEWSHEPWQLAGLWSRILADVFLATKKTRQQRDIRTLATVPHGKCLRQKCERHWAGLLPWKKRVAQHLGRRKALVTHSTSCPSHCNAWRKKGWVQVHRLWIHREDFCCFTAKSFVVFPSKWSEVYMITGPPGVGKSEFTIWIAGRCPRSVQVFSHFCEHLPCACLHTFRHTLQKLATTTPKISKWKVHALMSFYVSWVLFFWPSSFSWWKLWAKHWLGYPEMTWNLKWSAAALSASTGQLGVPVYRLCLSSPRLSDDRLAQFLDDLTSI